MTMTICHSRLFIYLFIRLDVVTTLKSTLYETDAAQADPDLRTDRMDLNPLRMAVREQMDLQRRTSPRRSTSSVIPVSGTRGRRVVNLTARPCPYPGSYLVPYSYPVRTRCRAQCARTLASVAKLPSQNQFESQLVVTARREAD